MMASMNPLRFLFTLLALLPLCQISAQAQPKNAKHIDTPRNSVIMPMPPQEAPPPRPPLPADAEAVMGEYNTALSELKARTIRKLQPLQDKYTRGAKLDEALAIRFQIRELKNMHFLQVWRVAQERDIGQKFIVDIVGAIGGQVWGSDPYTADSDPSSVAVHAGLLKAGERAQIEFEILKGEESYPGSTKNGVTTLNFGRWNVSMRAKKAEL